jgi:hypothetical protein
MATASEIAMKEYSFTRWIHVRARRLRLYRALASSLWWLVGLILAANLVRWAFPGLRSELGGARVPLAALFDGWLLGVFLVSAGFFYGLIRCPSCDSPFAPRLAPVSVPRRCQACGFDIYTLKRTSSGASSWRRGRQQ